MTEEQKNDYWKLTTQEKLGSLTKQEKKKLDNLTIEYLKDKIHNLRKRLEFYKKHLNNDEAHYLCRYVPSSSLAQNILKNFPEKEREMAKDFFRKNPELCYDEAKEELASLKSTLFATKHPVLKKIGQIFDGFFEGERFFTDEEMMEDANPYNMDLFDD